MSQSSPHLVPVRAIEDIIQTEKNNDNLPKVIESEIFKEKIEDVDYSFNKHNPVNTFVENHICLPKIIEGNVVQQSDIKFRKRLEVNGSEGDHKNSELIHLEDLRIIEKTDSELELKSWPSDSDITIIRMKKEYRNELSSRVNWEEERNLIENNSSLNLEWESHSLINLANITLKEIDDAERLTPFTIWSKSGCQNDLDALNQNSEPPGNEYVFTNTSVNENSKNLLFHPSEESAFFTPARSNENRTSDQTFTESKVEISPILDEKINMLYRTELSSSQEKSIHDKPERVSDFSPCGNKSSQSGKLKLLRSFFHFITKCGSNRKSAINNTD